MKMKKYRRSGWYGERHRHYLAAKGISTRLKSEEDFKKDLPRNSEFLRFSKNKDPADFDTFDESRKNLTILKGVDQRNSLRHYIDRLENKQFLDSFEERSLQDAKKRLQQFEEEDIDRVYFAEKNSTETNPTIYVGKNEDGDDVWFVGDDIIEVEGDNYFAFKTKGERVEQVPIQEAYVKRGIYNLPDAVNVFDDGFYQEGIKRPSQRESEELRRWIEDPEFEPRPDGEIKEEAWNELVEAKKKKFLEGNNLSEEDVVFSPYKIPRDLGGHTVVKVRYRPEVFKERVDEQMVPAKSGASLWEFDFSDKGVARKKYMEELTNAVASDEEKVPPIGDLSSKPVRERKRLGEGRHRILAAQRAGLKEVPVRSME